MARPVPAVRNRLDVIGIDDVCDMIENMMSLRDIAKQVGVDVAELSRWLDRPQHSARADQSRARSSVLWDEESEKVLKEATDPLQVSKARELAHHYRWRARMIDPKRYGDRSKVTHEGKIGLEALISEAIGVTNAETPAAPLLTHDPD
jgi:hypothetical protein